ncbi:SDR family oxidoreductase [Stappia sp.]|uniref:SDR family oxidoreductase n=1 Tax=Stappia sp. TaxID=1870903 RepID=UPI0032D98272
MDLKIKGRKALALGASRGLGLGIANALAAEGVEVLLCGRSADLLERNAAEIAAAHGVAAHHVSADLADGAFAERVAGHARAQLGHVDILVNNTGGPAPGKVTDMSADDLARQAQMMIFGIIDLTNRLLPAMREKGWGRVLTVASSGVVQPIPNLAMSNTLRSALVGWNKSLSNEIAADGVTCNLLVPGRIHTARVDQLDEAAANRTGKTLEEVRAGSKATIPAGRYGRVEEFADMATFLCSDRAGYTTGSIVRCDGGAIKGV